MAPMLSPTAKQHRLQLIAAAHCKGLAGGVHVWVSVDAHGAVEFTGDARNGVACVGCGERRATADVRDAPDDLAGAEG